MLQSLSVSRAVQPFRVSSRATSDAPPSPSPTPPPTIDFSTIDSPAKASLLPSLNATSWFVMLTAMAQVGPVASDLQMTLGGNTAAHVVYTPIAGQPGVMTLQVRGNLGDTPLKETWCYSPDNASFSVSGSVGGTPESLTVGGAEDGNHLDGAIGGLPVHEVIAFEGDGDAQRLVFSGTVGDQAVHQSIQIVDNADGSQLYHLVGTLGNPSDGSALPITTDITVKPTDQRGLSLSGQGNIAGTSVDGYVQTMKPSMEQPPAPIAF